METNIILAGVGGQGIVSISYVIDVAALDQGLNFKQAEAHGMSQRGGAVSSHLRVSDRPIHSDLVPKGGCDIVLAVEPLESLRYVDYLKPEATVVSGTDPYVNIDNYTDIEQILDTIGTLENHTLLPANRLARQAGSGRAQNMVLLGAASPNLGLRQELLEKGINGAFASKGEKVQKTNIDAFRLGIEAGKAYRACVKAGMSSKFARNLTGRLSGGLLQADAIALWKQLSASEVGCAVLDILRSANPGNITGTPDLPKAILSAKPSTPMQLQELLLA